MPYRRSDFATIAQTPNFTFRSSRCIRSATVNN
jgi:hypothetical protein